MSNAEQAGPTGRGWIRWLGIVALVLGYGTLFAVKPIHIPRRVTVRGHSQELGPIDLVQGEGPSGISGWVSHFNVSAEPAAVWKMLGDCRNWPRVLEGFNNCRLIRSEGKTVKIFHLDIYSKRANRKAFMERRTVIDGARRRTQWKQIRGTLQAAEGGIEVQAHPTRPGWSRVSFHYYVKIHPLVPMSFESPRLRKSVKAMSRQIQRYFTRRHSHVRRVGTSSSLASP